MAAKTPRSLPLPPADLASRKLPLVSVRGTLFRIHRSALPCLFFGKDGSSRFDDPTKQYGVLYASLKPEAAFAEVFLRQLSMMLILEADLRDRAIAEIACKNIQCVDMTGAGLRQLSCDNRISTETSYGTTGCWSRALFEHPQQPGGIVYLSRHNSRFKCVALFDRCQRQLKINSSVGLLSPSYRNWTISQVSNYNLAVQS